MGRLIEEPKVFEIMKRHWLSGSIAHHIIDDIRNDIIKNVPTVEAIPKADYENRLKADMVAMLDELDLEVDELVSHFADGRIVYRYQLHNLIQQKINALKVENKMN